MVRLSNVWLQASCASAQVFLRSQSWSSWKSSFPDGEVSMAYGFDCNRVESWAGTTRTNSGCADVYWGPTVVSPRGIDSLKTSVAMTTQNSILVTTRKSTPMTTCSPTWVYGTNMPHNSTNSSGSSYSGSIRTITNTKPRLVTVTLSSEVETKPEAASKEIIVGPAVVATLTTGTLSAETITETHTYSATFMTTVTTSLLCTCGESGLSATGMCLYL